jgi:hypothetical protein
MFRLQDIQKVILVILFVTTEVILLGILVEMNLVGFINSGDCDADLRSLEILEVLLNPIFF